MKFLVKFFPEITIKSKPVRQLQVKQLWRNIKDVFSKSDLKAQIIKHWDFIEVLPKDSEDKTACIELLKCVPGIANFSLVSTIEVEDPDQVFQQMLQLAIDAFSETLRDKSFVVRIKRVGDHTFTSHQLEQYIGGGLLQAVPSAKVQLKNPDYVVKMELRFDQIFVVTERYEGLGGFPMGTQEAAMSLISGGFDSTVSSFLAMKRGIRTHFCFFNLGGSAHEIGVKQVALYLWEKYGLSHRVNFVTVPFEPIVEEIAEHVHHSLMGVVLKRMMMRAAEAVAKDMNVPMLVTGEAIGQVSSQTIANLSLIDEAINHTVVRPLVFMDKRDIIDLARSIGTEDFAKNMPEYCGVLSDKPSTKADRQRVIDAESLIDMAKLDQCIQAQKVIKVDKVLETVVTEADVEVVRIPQADDLVVDIRHPIEAEKAPLFLTNNEVLHIPFYELQSRLDQLGHGRRILMYCAKGLMSQVHAGHLQSQGYQNVKVFSPL